MTPTHIGESTGTVADDPTPATVAPPRPLWQVAVVGLLVLTVATTAGAGIWQVLGNRGDGVSSRITDPETNSDDSKPQAAAPWLPPGTARAVNAVEVPIANGPPMYDWVQGTLNGRPVRFRLIASNGAPFYIMESKVWNDLYAAGGVVPAESSANGANHPVTHVTGGDAAEFAKKLGGRLPSPEEWDRAAGLYANTGRDEVTLAGGQPRVSRNMKLLSPLPTHGKDAGSDVNTYGLRDMAGNGREWTSRTLPSKEGESARNVLRGRCFTFKDGLTYSELRRQASDRNAHAQYWHVGSPYTSFRVVLPGPQ